MDECDLVWDAELISLEEMVKDVKIEIGYTLKNGSLRHKTFVNLQKAFDFWMDKFDGTAAIVTNSHTYSAYTHREHFGLWNNEVIYKHFLEGITSEV